MDKNKEALENQQDKQQLGEEDLNTVSGGGLIQDIMNIGKCQFVDNGTLYLHTTERYYFSKCIHVGNIAVCNQVNCPSNGTPKCLRGSHYTDKNGVPENGKIYKEEGDGVTNYVEGVR